jgi:hypothetical protein
MTLRSLQTCRAELEQLKAERDALKAELHNTNAPEPQPMSVDQISMIFNRVYPAQPLSQNIINLVQEVEKHHGIR